MQKMQKMQVWSLGFKDPLEEGMAIHSSILPWGIPWTEKPYGLQSMELQRVEHDWNNLACTQVRQKRLQKGDLPLSVASISEKWIYFLSIKLFLVRHHGAVSVHKGRREWRLLTTWSLTDCSASLLAQVWSCPAWHRAGWGAQYRAPVGVSYQDILGSACWRQLSICGGHSPKHRKGQPHMLVLEREKKVWNPELWPPGGAQKIFTCSWRCSSHLYHLQRLWSHLINHESFH